MTFFKRSPKSGRVNYICRKCDTSQSISFLPNRFLYISSFLQLIEQALKLTASRVPYQKLSLPHEKMDLQCEQL